MHAFKCQRSTATQAQAQEATVWHLRQGSRSDSNTSAVEEQLTNHTH